MTTIINSLGKMAGWNSVTCRLFGRDIVGITKISYDDEQDKENVYGVGKMPVGQSEGKYKAKASIELSIEERLAIQNSLPSGVRIQDIAAFPIVIAYEYGGKIYKDVLNNCGFKNNGVDVKQGDKTISTDFSLNISHINWNV
jgi:hypothetical protein